MKKSSSCQAWQDKHFVWDFKEKWRPISRSASVLPRLGERVKPDYGFVTDMTSVSYPLVYLELHTENKDMRHLLSGVAIIAALAIPTLASAQRMGPGPYAYTGTGPGVTPPGGFGPSSPLYNQPAGSPSAPNAAPSGSGPTWATTPPAPGSMPPPVYPQAR